VWHQPPDSRADDDKHGQKEFKFEHRIMGRLEKKRGDLNRFTGQQPLNTRCNGTPGKRRLRILLK